MRWIVEAASAGATGIGLVANDRSIGIDGHSVNTRSRLRHPELPLDDDLLTFGVDRGIVTATRLALLDVLTARGLSLSEEDRRAVETTDSIGRLLRWLDAAVIGESVTATLRVQSEEDDHRVFSAIADDRWAEVDR